MAPIRLYTQTNNPFSEKVARGLRLKRLPYERVVSDDPADVKHWSPVTERLPVLEVDGERRADSTAILHWLDELCPEPPLRAGDPRTRAAQERLAQWSDSSLLFYWDRWRAARYPRPGDELPANPSLLDSLRSRIERTFGRPPSTLSRVELREVEVMEELAKRLDDLVGFLGARPFFYSEKPSIADLSVAGMLHLLGSGPMPGEALLAERPSLAGHMERMEKLTAATPPVADEGSSPPPVERAITKP